jgi:TRAP-type uncharacterized transport system fused permease subunit
LAIAAFIIPYVFVLSPELLMIDALWHETLFIVITATAGMFGVSAGLIGFWLRPMRVWERLCSAAAGLLLIYPGWISDTIGFGTLALLLGWQMLQLRKEKIAALG